MAVNVSYRNGIENSFHQDWTVFIATFARFEYAQKRAGFLRHIATGRAIEADWDSFSNALGQDFVHKCQETPEAHILFDQPLKLFRVNSLGNPTWQAGRQITNCVDLFLVVRDVRNSLFHGEKHVHSERDQLLIRAAQSVLDLAWGRAATNDAQTKLKDFVQSFQFY